MFRFSMPRNLFLIFALALTAFSANGTAWAAEPVRVRILSYNIHHGEGVDGKVDLERLARVIKSTEPDLVALQEVDRNTQRTGKVDQPAEFARLTGMHVFFGWNIPYQGGDYGNAILSKHPIKQTRNHPLPSFYKNEQRGVIEAEINLPGFEPPLLFLATHLDYRSGSQERPASVKKIAEVLSTSPNRPALLAGDLNDRIGSETLRGFDSSWTRVNSKEMPTFPVDKPTRQIDFILTRPAQGWKVIEARVLDEAIASDHRAFFAILEWQPTPERSSAEGK